MSRTKKDIEQIKFEYRVHYNRVYRQLATQLFLWEGLPEGIPYDFIEKQLFDRGSILFAHDKNLGYYAINYSNSGMIDMYERPTHYNLISHTSLGGKQLRRDECVIIKNNIEDFPTYQMLKKNIEELVELNITKLSNITWQRIPVIFQGNDKTAQSLKSLIEDTIQGASAISIVDKSLSLSEGVQSIDTKSEYLGAELRDEYRMITGELLTMLGINNLEISKKERLVSAEAEINKEEVGINLLAFLKPRQESAKRLNKMFGLNVKVRVNPLLVKMEEVKNEEEVKLNENDNY